MWFSVSLRWISFSFSYFAPKSFKLSRGSSNLTPIQQHECKEWKWTKIIGIEDFWVIKLTECGTRSPSDCNLRELQTSETMLPIKQFIYFSRMFCATRFIPFAQTQQRNCSPMTFNGENHSQRRKSITWFNPRQLNWLDWIELERVRVKWNYLLKHVYHQVKINIYRIRFDTVERIPQAMNLLIIIQFIRQSNPLIKSSV